VRERERRKAERKWETGGREGGRGRWKEDEE
jgi:hypothetical protein